VCCHSLQEWDGLCEFTGKTVVVTVSTSRKVTKCEGNAASNEIGMNEQQPWQSTAAACRHDGHMGWYTG
jgi:hypothetical protein